MRKKVALISAVVAVGALVAVGASLAFFTGTDTATNTITTGYVNVDVKEDVPTVPDGEKWTATGTDEGVEYGNVVPGTTILKNPSVIYTGTSDGYVRYQVQILDGADQAITLDAAKVHFLGADGTEVQGLTFGEWVYGDGTDAGAISKYNANVNGGVVINPIFAKIKFDDTIGNELSNTQIKIKVVAQAIQADNVTVNNKADLVGVFDNTTIEAAPVQP